jgi:hypothetical protein
LFASYTSHSVNEKKIEENRFPHLNLRTAPEDDDVEVLTDANVKCESCQASFQPPVTEFESKSPFCDRCISGLITPFLAAEFHMTVESLATGSDSDSEGDTKHLPPREEEDEHSAAEAARRTLQAEQHCWSASSPISELKNDIPFSLVNANYYEKQFSPTGRKSVRFDIGELNSVQPKDEDDYESGDHNDAGMYVCMYVCCMEV